jgi:amino acid adenylation domain-containing protein
MPFEKLVEVLAPQRDLSRTPLFQVFFNHIRVDPLRNQAPGLEMETTGAVERDAKFDLTLYVWERDDAVQFSALYNADLFTSQRISILLEQYQHLLEQVVAAPDGAIAAFSLVTAREDAVLPELSQPLEPGWSGTVAERITRWAAIQGSATALQDGQASYNYQELEQMSNGLAQHLAATGIGPNDVVAVYGHRSAGLVLALLGIMKAGAAFLILDPVYPASRLTHMITAADPRGMITLEAAGPSASLIFDHPLAYRVTLPYNKQEQQALLTCENNAPPAVSCQPDQKAYIIFTSGTAGRPKGIIGTHRPLSHFLEWTVERFGFSPADRFSMLSGLGHDPLLRDIFAPLWAGATLCIPDQERMLMPQELCSWMRDEQVTVAHLTPAMGHLLSEGGETELPALRYLFFGGDTLNRNLVEKLQSTKAPRARLVNFYGATETPQAMGYHVIQPEPGSDLPQQIPLGQGIEGAQVVVLNGALEQAGVGEMGDIHVRTPYLSAGYLNDDQLTAQKFIVNPHGSSDADRLYYTGDLGRYRLDGEVVFCGRRDHQVSIRGFRVELQEIETVLAGCPGVGKCAVIVKGHEGGDRYLVAFAAVNADLYAGSDAAREYLRGHLPDYMMPRSVVSVDDLPLTPNGKIDRRQLDAIKVERSEAAPDALPPQSEMETILADIWKEALGIDSVSVHENFFDLGGHSLLSIQVITNIEKRIGIRINPREFTYQNLGQIAALLEKQLEGGDSELTTAKKEKFINRLAKAISMAIKNR